MKVLNTNQLVIVPEGIDVSVKSRVVTVKGARGTLTKTFRHLAVDMYMPDKQTVKVKPCFLYNLKCNRQILRTIGLLKPALILKLKFEIV